MRSFPSFTRAAHLTLIGAGLVAAPSIRAQESVSASPETQQEVRAILDEQRLAGLERWRRVLDELR